MQVSAQAWFTQNASSVLPRVSPGNAGATSPSLARRVYAVTPPNAAWLKEQDELVGVWRRLPVKHCLEPVCNTQRIRREPGLEAKS